MKRSIKTVNMTPYHFIGLERISRILPSSFAGEKSKSVAILLFSLPDGQAPASLRIPRN